MQASVPKSFFSGEKNEGSAAFTVDSSAEQAEASSRQG
jgi:hypothetical protein